MWLSLEEKNVDRALLDDGHGCRAVRSLELVLMRIDRKIDSE